MKFTKRRRRSPREEFGVFRNLRCWLSVLYKNIEELKPVRFPEPKSCTKTTKMKKEKQDTLSCSI